MIYVVYFINRDSSIYKDPTIFNEYQSALSYATEAVKARTYIGYNILPTNIDNFKDFEDFIR